MIISLYAIPIWIAVVLILSLSTVIFWGSKRLSSRVFSISIFFVAAMTAGMAYFLFNTNVVIQDFGTRLTTILSCLAAISLPFFAYTYKKERWPGFFVTLFSIALWAGMSYLILFTTSIIDYSATLKFSETGIKLMWYWGPLSVLMYVYISCCHIICLGILISAFRQNKDKFARRHTLIIIMGFIIGMAASLIFNTIFPQMGMFDYTWIGPTAGIVWVSIIAYSIVRYHQMNVRVVATEVLILALSIITFVNIFFGDTLGIGGRIGVFCIFLILGVFLIRGTVRESEQSEKLKDLNLNLQQRVEEQTREIRHSYEVERAARLELEKVDQTKNQFIMITQHHLRTPITSIKWQLESIMGGTYGEATVELKKALNDMGESVERLNHLINSLLSISALRAGIETLTMARTDMNEMIERILGELHKEIDRKHIAVEVSSAHQPWPQISVDAKRMDEVLFIIVENAVRYNVDNGSITISGKADESKFELTVENTGIELSPEEKAKMFSELFYRSTQAQVVHPTGMGIGLTMAQAIIEAHHGSISINPRKTGGGVKVVITLPY